MLAAREAARRDPAATSPPVTHGTWNITDFNVALVDIGPADRWIPGYFNIIGPLYDARQQSSWRVDVIKAMRYWREGEPVESLQTWWTRHLGAYMDASDKSTDMHGLPRYKVPPDLRAAFVFGDKIEGHTVNEQGRANSRSVLDVRRSCRVAPSPGTANPSPSVLVSEAKHSQPLREVIDACRASLLKKSQPKKAWQIKQHAAAVAYRNTEIWWEELSTFRRKVAACWVLREDARRRQEGAAREVAAREVAQVAMASKARAVAAAGGGEGGNGGPAGALEASGAVQVLMRCLLQHF